MKKNVFEKKKCVILGGNSDIGRCVINELLESGAEIEIYSRKVTKKYSTHKNVNFNNSVKLFKFDIDNEEDVDLLIENIESKPIDYLFNFIGALKIKPFIEYRQSEISQYLDTNLTNFITLYSKILKIVLNQRRKNKVHIVHIGSMAGIAIGHSQFSLYSATKHALEGLFNSLASEFEDQNLEFILVTPAGVNTKMLKNATKNISINDKAIEKLDSPDEVAHGIVNNFTKKRFRSGVRFFPTPFSLDVYEKIYRT